MDILQLSIPRAELDRFFAGQHIAEVWRPPLKVAAVMLPEGITRFAENTAVNRGANFIVMADAAEAVEWLLENP